MLKLFSTQSKKLIKVVDKSEAELNIFLSENWNDFFPQYTFIKSEFSIEGNVRSKSLKQMFEANVQSKSSK